MEIFKSFKEHVVSSDNAVEQAIARTISKKNTKQYIKNNFSVLVTRIQLETYKIYQDSQLKAGKQAIKEYLSKTIPPKASRTDTITITSKQFEEFNSFFLSLTNPRRPRAGAAFQVVIRTLFRSLGYPFQEQQVIDGKPDFILPSKEHFQDKVMDCIVLAIKRTLSERWRQIISEGAGVAFYLATIDEELSPTQLKAMQRNRIFVVVPKAIKAKYYRKAANVISFEDFFTDHLDPAVKRWKHEGII
jgi:hypothetical protein